MLRVSARVAAAPIEFVRRCPGTVLHACTHVRPYVFALPILVAGCHDVQTVAPTVSRQMLGTAGAMALVNCNASFRLISTSTDSLLAPYGIATSVDTADICESWTGSDYAYQATGVGSSDNIPGYADTVQTVVYQGGAATGYAADGSAVTSSVSTQGTSFDFLYADSATRQASYDYPYYGVGSPAPGGCTTPPCPVVERAVPLPARSGAPATAPAPLPFHGLSRRGVRALLANAQEIGRSPEGYRRFQTVHGGETHTFSVDPATELIMAERSTDATDTTDVRHAWQAVSGGNVRTRSDFTTSEVIAGKRVRSSMTLLFQKVRISDPVFQPQPLVGAGATP